MAYTHLTFEQLDRESGLPCPTGLSRGGAIGKGAQGTITSWVRPPALEFFWAPLHFGPFFPRARNPGSLWIWWDPGALGSPKRVVPNWLQKDFCPQGFPFGGGPQKPFFWNFLWQGPLKPVKVGVTPGGKKVGPLGG